MAKRLTVNELAALRDRRALDAAVESTLASADIADRERSGLLMRGNGTLVRKRKRDGVYVSAVKSTARGVSVTSKPQVQVVPGAEVRAWDAMVKADRRMVALGCRSMLVKVVKGERRPTLADAHIIIVPVKGTEPDTAEPGDIMAWLKAKVEGSPAE